MSKKLKKKVNYKLFLRRTSQIFFLVFFLYLFINTQPEIVENYYDVRAGKNADIFFRSDPLLIISASVSSRSILSNNFFPAVFLVILAIFFGRYFCGWICPLGTCIDTAALPVKSKHKKREKLPERYFHIKYYLLLCLLILAIASMNLVGIFDPITITFRTLAFTADPFIHFIIKGIFDPLGTNVHISRFSEPLYNLLLNNILTFEKYSFKFAWLYALIFIVILFLYLFHRRLWCTWFCPLGAFYGLFSPVSIFQRNVKDNCVECGICAKECKMGAISSDTAKDCNIKECILCFSCEAVCPVNAINFHPKKPKLINASKKSEENSDDKQDTTKSNIRRNLLISGGSVLIAFPLIKILADKQYIDKKLLRPPGVRYEQEFLNKCIRCGECMRVCTRNALHPSLSKAGAEGIWTPMLIPRIGYCEYYCNICGKVCPTGAIKLLSVPDKIKWKIGLAEFNHKKCIPWSQNINCSVCEEACPVHDKAIKLIEKEVEREDGTKEIVKYPYVSEPLCIGCGICENKCPVEGESAIRVFKRG